MASQSEREIAGSGPDVRDDFSVLQTEGRQDLVGFLVIVTPRILQHGDVGRGVLMQRVHFVRIAKGGVLGEQETG